MESVWEHSLPIIQALQSVAWLEWPMRLISQLGSEPFFLLFISLLYWCISPRLGMRVALILLLSTSLNVDSTISFQRAQPYIAYSLRYLRYTLLGGWIAAGAPLIFWGMRRSR